MRFQPKLLFIGVALEPSLFCSVFVNRLFTWVTLQNGPQTAMSDKAGPFLTQNTFVWIHTNADKSFDKVAQTTESTVGKQEKCVATNVLIFRNCSTQSGCMMTKSAQTRQMKRQIGVKDPNTSALQGFVTK